MTTVYDISYQVMRQVTDVLNGTATAGTSASLTDTNNLTQPNEYYDNGTLWIRSGTHANKVARVKGHASNKLTFADLGSAIAADVRYAVATSLFPFEQVIAAMQTALDETHVTGEDDSRVGDGATLEFSLPAGVYDIVKVEFERPSVAGYRTISNHWHEKAGKIRWDYGYPPNDDDVIHIFYRKPHNELTGYASEISTEVNRDWLVLTTAKELLFWGLSMYSQKKEYMLEDRLNKVLNQLKGKRARIDGPIVIVKTAGGGDGY